MKTPNPDDLLVAARRRPISTSEQRQLQMLGDASPESKLLLDAGKGFDAEGEPQPGDRLLLRRLVARTVSARTVRPHRRVLSAVLLASAISGAASAAVAIAIVAMPRRDVAINSASPTAPTVSAQAIVRRQATITPTVPKSADVLSTMPSSPSSPSSTVGQCAPLPSGSADAAALRPSAATAYSDANALRRGRKIEEAIIAYRQLIARHPSTPEARQSTIALGNLLLETERTAQALAVFQTYRKGPLDEEAAWGQLRALLALGRTEEAREVLGALEAAHPASPYVVAARRRLSRAFEQITPAPSSTRGP
jgi:TolA-binding protein